MSDIYYIVAHRNQEEINSFKSRYDNFDITCIPTIFSQTLNLKVNKIERSTSWGSSHVIFFVSIEGLNRPLIFRANLGFNKKPEYVMKAEKLICDEVAKLNIPTNKVIFVDISRKKYPFDYQIQECLIGSDIENNFNDTREVYDDMSCNLGKYIGMYSKIKFDKFGIFDAKAVEKNKLIGTKNTFFEYIISCLEQDISYLIDAKVITTSLANSITRLFNEYKPIINSVSKGSLIHHDLADHNIFFKGNVITGIFDWEAAVIGDPVLDLASCPTWKTFYPREKKLIEGYMTITPLPDFFTEKMNIYRLRTMLWKIVYAIRMNILNDNRKKKFLETLKPFGLL